MKVRVTVDDRLNEMRPRHCEPPNGVQITVNVGGRTNISIIVNTDGSGSVSVNRDNIIKSLEWKADIQGREEEYRNYILPQVDNERIAK